MVNSDKATRVLVDIRNPLRTTSSQSLKQCNIPFRRLEALASDRDTWRSTCAFGMSYFDAEYYRAAALRCSRRHQHAAAPRLLPDSICQCHFMADNATHALASTVTVKLPLNDEEEDVDVRHVWTPEYEKRVIIHV